MEIYRGGLPVLHTRRQRGSGFLSALKRYVLPIAKRALPHITGAISDIASGDSVKDTLKRRAADAGSDALHGIADIIKAPSAAKIPRRRSPSKKRGKNVNTNIKRKKGALGRRRR